MHRLIVVVLCLWASIAKAQEVRPLNTGRGWMELYETGQDGDLAALLGSVGYVAGLADMMTAYVVFERTTEVSESYMSCVGGWDGVQSSAVLYRWLKDHPASWQQQTTLLWGEAIREHCGFAPFGFVPKIQGSNP